MDDSFKLRVDRIFGSLSSSSSSSSPAPAFNSSLSSLWCLTDDEIERREWIKAKEDEPEPESELEPTSLFAGGRKLNQRNSLGFRNEFDDDVDDLDENPESNGSSSSKFLKPDDYGDEEWEIKSSIGRDCTLDFEEEEDEFDKVAVGMENDEDRLYMKGITETDCGVEIDPCPELPTSVRNFTRDPRANHSAAIVRLKEDAEASKTIGSLQVSENGAVGIAIADSECNASQNPKSILKRKDNHLDAKSHKRVRFNPECIISQESQGLKEMAMEANSSPGVAEVGNEATIPSRGYPTQVPDYLQNPSRYTHYTFDSSNGVDEESNKKAYMDFLQLVRGAKTIDSHQNDALTGPPKSITFIPKKKAGDTIMLENPAIGGEQNHPNGVGKELVHPRGIPIGIAAVDTRTDDVCSMEEDEPDKLERRNSSQKPGRQYRMRAKMDSEEA